jgi:hypothetical protein
MNIGLRTLLLVVAVVLFVIATFSNTHELDLMAWGLAVLAAAFVVDELGIGPRTNRRV